MNKNRKQQARPAPRNDIDPPQQRNGIQDALPVAQDAPQQARRDQRPQQNVPVVAAPRPIRQRNPPDWYQAKPKSNSSKNQRPGPSNQVFQSRNSQSNTGEDQENMEVEEDGDQKAPIKKNERGAKRRREISACIHTDEVDTHDAAASSEATPISSRAAIEEEAPKHKAARMEQEDSDEQMRKGRERQQKIKEDKRLLEQQPKMNEQREKQQKEKEQNEKPLEHRLEIEQQKNEQLQQQEKEGVEKMKKQLEQQREQRRENEGRMDEEQNEQVQNQGQGSQEHEQQQMEVDLGREEQQQVDNEQVEVDQHRDVIQVQDNGNESIGNNSAVLPCEKELEVVVEKDELVIQPIPKKEQHAIFEEAKKFIDSKNDVMVKKLASKNSEETKWDVVICTLQKIAKDLSRDTFFSSTLQVFKNVVKIFKEGMLKCKHQQDEEKALYEICQEFTRIMSTAFCCGRYFIATSVDESCSGHGDNCKIKEGHLCYKSDDKYYCSNWLENGRNRTKKMREAIYRHFTPEQYEMCTHCDTVWHQKCRLNRLLHDPKSIDCRSTNDMLHFKNFSDHIGKTTLQLELSKNYHSNRGTLPKLQFIHSICSEIEPDKKEMEKVLADSKEFTYTANQIFVTAMIRNVETMIFAFTTQEYRSGPKKGWVVIEYLDSLSILKENRSRIYKRILWSYLKYARECGFKVAHLWSCAPVQGVDYIFSGHPKSQIFLSKSDLNGWYTGFFKGGNNEEFGMMDVGYAEKYFDEVLEKTTVEEMCRSLILANGFWNGEIPKILEKMPNNEEQGSSFEYFKNEIKKVIAASKDSLFYVKLRKGGQNGMEILLETTKPQEKDLFSNDKTGDRDEFLDQQCLNDIEFTDLRQAQFATRQILMVVYQARHGNETKRPRNVPEPFSVFSRGSPQWSHQ